MSEQDRAALVEELAIKLFEAGNEDMAKPIEGHKVLSAVSRFAARRNTWPKVGEDVREKYRRYATIAIEHIEEKFVAAARASTDPQE